MSTKLLRPITPDEVASYHKVGVVHLKAVLDLKMVNQLRQAIDETVDSLDASPAGYDFSQLVEAANTRNFEELASNDDGQYQIQQMAEYIKSSGDGFLQDGATGKGHFLVDTGSAMRIKKYRAMLIRGILPEIAAAFLNSEKVNFFGEQVFVKEPGTKERTAFHQDATYFEVEGNQCCVMWIPVDPTSLETGTMQYVRGSHLGGNDYKPNTFVTQTALPGSEGVDLPDIEGSPEAFDLVHFNTEPGDIIIHHFKTIHGTGGNMSRYQPRRAASVRYTGDDIRFKSRPYAPRQMHHKQRLDDGASLSGPDFPVVWRKAREDSAA